MGVGKIITSKAGRSVKRDEIGLALKVTAIRELAKDGIINES